MRVTKQLLSNIEKSYNMIVKSYGESKYYDDIPYLDIMAKESIKDFTNEFADGKIRKKDLELIQGWFCPNTNSISLVLENIDSTKDVVKCILHEYQHYLQSPNWISRYYNMGHTYSTHPYEVQATKAERNWKQFLIK
jgi:hypothetical protein